MWLYRCVANPVMRAVLKSPLHRVTSGALMLLTYRGRRSGRSYTIPVQYVRQGERVIVYPGRAGKKTWWRNLVKGAPVTVRIGGTELDGHAVAITDDREAIGEGLRAFLRRFPSAGRSLGVPRDANGEPDREALARAAERSVIVRIDLQG